MRECLEECKAVGRAVESEIRVGDTSLQAKCVGRVGGEGVGSNGKVSVGGGKVRPRAEPGLMS